MILINTVGTKKREILFCVMADCDMLQDEDGLRKS